MRMVINRAVRAAGALVGLAACTGITMAATLTGVDIVPYGSDPLVPGSLTTAGDKMTIVGSGSDIWNASDLCFYAYMPVTGDFDYIMKVESLVGCSGDGGWSKVELMARNEESDGVGPQDTDEHISNMTTRPSSDTPAVDPNSPDTVPAAGVNYRGPQWRATRGGLSSWTTPNPVITPNLPNNWVRLERAGDVFYMYWSNDGTNWAMYNPFSPQGWDTTGSWPTGTDNPTVAYFTNAWPAKIMLGIAVTAHSTIPGQTTTAVVSNFKTWTPVPIAITTQPPATKAVTASMPLELSIAATGDPVHYEWRKDGNPIPRAVSPTLTIPIATLADSGTYTCRVFGGGNEIISSGCLVTVTADTTAPTLVDARADGSFTAVTVTFDGPMGGSATNLANYSISPSLAITAAEAVPLTATPAFFAAVKLTTAKQALGTTYTLTVNNVKDYSGNTIAANSQITFLSAQELKGFAFWERWDDANGDLGDLNAFGAALEDTTNPVRPPDVTRTVTSFDSPWGTADNYNSRLRTYFTPAVTGTYVFYVSSDDNSNLYLSTDDNPANKKLIAQERGWSNDLQWTSPGEPVLAADGTGIDGNWYKSSLEFQSQLPYNFTGPEDVWGGDIELTAGKKYYLEARQNEGGGGDGVGATFVVSPATVANGSASALTGNVIAWFESIDNLIPSFLIQPVGSITLAPGATTNIWVQAFGSKLNYQWQLNGKDIAGATATNYTIASASLADIGQYSVNVTNPNGTATSSLCKVLVTATGTFTIEAEDFNYDGGKTMPAVSVMPYLGGAYTNLSAKFDIDYHNLDNPTDSRIGDTGLSDTTPGHPVYRYTDTFGNGDVLSNTNAPLHGVNIAGNMDGQWGSTRAGEWTMTANYKIGWISSGDWGNYTRTFPTPAKTYNVFAAQSYDGRAAGQLNSSISLVTAGADTTAQTLQPVGKFDCTGSAGWSQNNLVAMTDDAGAIKTVEIGGTQTIRWAYNSGDADYLLFIPAGSVGPILGIAKDGANLKVTYTGTLQSADTVTGPFTDVTGATSPYAVTPSGAMKFFRARE